MSEPRLSPEEIDRILRALQHRQQVSYRTPRQFHADYVRWCESRRRPVEASHETVRQWLGQAQQTKAETADKSNFPRRKKTSFYDFVVELAESLDPNDWPGLLTRSVNALFPSGHADDVSILNRFVGQYELIQHQWRPGGTDDCIANIVTFNRVNSAISYSERQKFVSGYSVDLKHDGYVFLAGNCVWIIAQEIQRQSFKFLTIHYFDPPLLAAVEPFYVCRGNFIAVWGSNDNPSRRFVLRKPTKGSAACRILSKEQAKLLLDENDYIYLYP